jgi:hypothetical protein
MSVHKNDNYKQAVLCSYALLTDLFLGSGGILMEYADSRCLFYTLWANNS